MPDSVSSSVSPYACAITHVARTMLFIIRSAFGRSPVSATIAARAAAAAALTTLSASTDTAFDLSPSAIGRSLTRRARYDPASAKLRLEHLWRNNRLTCPSHTYCSGIVHIESTLSQSRFPGRSARHYAKRNRHPRMARRPATCRLSCFGIRTPTKSPRCPSSPRPSTIPLTATGWGCCPTPPLTGASPNSKRSLPIRPGHRTTPDAAAVEGPEAKPVRARQEEAEPGPPGVVRALWPSTRWPDPHASASPEPLAWRAFGRYHNYGP
jgi:hypothetical protein